MDHLSSCYFCGTAMDTPLGDYRVVPVELREDDAVATVTLCSTCHAKLERLLGPVAEAAGESGATVDAIEGTIQPSGDDRETSDAADSHAESQAGERAGDTDPKADPTAGETAPDGTATDDKLIEVDDELDAASGGSKTDDDLPGDEAEVDTDADEAENVEESGTEKTETDDAPTARTTVSALEYNKVMRLLQNREFPVDRAEIQTIAANAYGLAEHECAEVIDLAIDRGLIDERDGRLVRPE